MHSFAGHAAEPVASARWLMMSSPTLGIDTYSEQPTLVYCIFKQAAKVLVAYYIRKRQGHDEKPSSRGYQVLVPSSPHQCHGYKSESSALLLSRVDLI